MNTEGMTDITGVDLVKFVKTVYELSSPQGLGYLHFQDGGLSDDDAKSLIKDNPRMPVSLDYVRGRACKMTVYKHDEKLWIPSRWYDHSNSQLSELLARCDIKPKEAA